MLMKSWRCLSQHRSSVFSIAIPAAALAWVATTHLTASMADPPAAVRDDNADDEGEQYQLCTVICTRDDSLLDVMGIFKISDTAPNELNHTSVWFKCSVTPRPGQRHSTVSESPSRRVLTTQPESMTSRHRRKLTCRCVSSSPLTFDVRFTLTDLHDDQELLGFNSKVKFSDENGIVVLSANKGSSIMLLRLVPDKY